MQAAVAVAPARAGVSPRPVPAAWRQVLGPRSRSHLGRPTPLQHFRRTQLSHAPQALPGTDNLRELDIPAEARSNLPAWLTLLGYVAVQASNFRYTPTPELLFTGLAGYQLLWSALALLTSKFEFDRVGAVIAPIFLSVRALAQLASRISPLDTANGLFGYYLARDLPVSARTLPACLRFASGAMSICFSCPQLQQHGSRGFFQ